MADGAVILKERMPFGDLLQREVSKIEEKGHDNKW